MSLHDELQGSGFLRHFSPASLPRIAALAHLEEYPAATPIVSQGQPAGQVYLVLEGDVALEMKGPDQGPLQVYQIGRGSLLGWSAVLGSGPQTATARTLTRCRLAALDANHLRILGELDTQFGRELFRATAEALGERLRAMRTRLTQERRYDPHSMREGAD